MGALGMGAGHIYDFVPPCYTFREEEGWKEGGNVLTVLR